MTLGPQLAQIAMTGTKPNWTRILAGCTTPQAVEDFRVALLLEGRDTRSARRAISARHFALTYRRVEVAANA